MDGNSPGNSVPRTSLSVARAEARTMRESRSMSHLKQLFRFAAEREIIDASPIESMKKSRVGGSDTERERVLDDAEIRALTALLETAKLSKRTELSLWLILANVVRVGELIGAVWSTDPPPAKELAALGEACAVLSE